MNKRLHSHLYFHLKNIFTLKISSTVAKLLMEKPSNWIRYSKNVGKNLKMKEILRKEPASLLKISLWDSFQFLLVEINHLVSS